MDRLEQSWYEEVYEVGELKGFEGLSLELFADSYVEMKRNIYERERIKNDSEDIAFLSKYIYNNN